MSRKANTTTTTTETTTAEVRRMYSDAFKITVKQLKTMNATEPTPMIQRLLNEYNQNFIAYNYADRITELTELTNKHADTTELLNTIRQQLKRVTLSTDDRKTLDTAKRDTKRTADAETDAKQDIIKQYSNVNFTDFFDLVQIAIISLWANNPTESELTASRRTVEKLNEQTTADAEQHRTPSAFPHMDASKSALFFMNERTADDIQYFATRRNARNNIASFIRSSASPCLMDGTHTDRRDATADDVKQWIDNGHLLGDDYRLKLNNNTVRSLVFNRKKNKYQFVDRRKTYKQGETLEQYKNENGEYFIDGYFRTYNIYADTVGALERIEQLCNRAKITERERGFINAFCSAPARVIDLKSHIAYYNQYENTMNRNRLEKYASAFAYRQRIAYAIDRATGLKLQDSRQKFLRRLFEKLRHAEKTTEREKNAVHIVNHDFNYYDMMMTRNRGNAVIIADNHADILQWINTTATKRERDIIISWINRDTAERMHTEHAERTAEIFKNSKIDNCTADAVNRSHIAETRYKLQQIATPTGKNIIVDLSADEIIKIYNRYRKHTQKREKYKKIIETAKRSNICSLNTTFEQWKNWTDAERKLHDDYLNALKHI